MTAGSHAARAETRLGWLLAAPAVAIVCVVLVVPIAWTCWEALHSHDLRLPWRGRPFVGFANFVEAAGDARVRGALVHTAAFAAVTVPLELACGLALATVMHAALRWQGIIRTAALLPWAIPTVVAALIWRFMFEAPSGVALSTAAAAGLVEPGFDAFVHPLAAWIPVVAADVWKTTPFVAVLLLAALQTIDPALDEAARVDGASAIRRFGTITLPLLAPALVVAGTFRLLDAVRLFDLVYVLTGGGPGTATEPLSVYAFAVLTQRLRFGYGSALSVLVFLLALACAIGAVALLRRSARGERR